MVLQERSLAQQQQRNKEAEQEFYLVSVVFGIFISTCGFAPAELTGKPLAGYPFFQYTRSINENDSVFLAVDPVQFPSVVGEEADIHLVQSKLISEWLANPVLTDVRPGGRRPSPARDQRYRKTLFSLPILILLGYHSVAQAMDHLSLGIHVFRPKTGEISATFRCINLR